MVHRYSFKMMLLWLFPLLISLPHVQGRRDPCSGAFPEINRTRRFNVSNETHCVFVAPNDDNVLKDHNPEHGEMSTLFTLNITAARQQCAMFDAGLVQLRTGEMYTTFRKTGLELFGLVETELDNGPYIPLGLTVLSIDDNVTWGITTYTVKWDNGDEAAMERYNTYNDPSDVEWIRQVYIGHPVLVSIGIRRTLVTPNQTTFETPGHGGVRMVCHQEPLGPEHSTPSTRSTTPPGTAHSTPLLLQSTTTSSASLPVVLPSPVLSLALGIVIYDWMNDQ